MMNKLTKQRFSELVAHFELSALFNALGWDNFRAINKVDIKGIKYIISGIANKKDFCVLECVIDDNKMPPAVVRKQFERAVSKLYHDHLLVFTDKNRTTQYWQLPLREEGKLKRLVTFVWRSGQDTEGLYQKFRNIVFTLDEEENITLLDVKERVNASFSINSEKVTKKFYAEFTKQHEAFLAFIKGMDDAIPDKDNFNKKWYASLMMNRLMFCYFIQKKRFLDWNDNYLQDKLNECNKLKGADNFYGFYRSFLLELFHDELANPEEKRRKKKIPVKFGDIPYLNGGLFEVHYLEDTYKDIAITDEAFQNIFDFFDEWEWHLDTRITASGRDINPDVIGYIFEKYINNRADMGAYYTKEDITDYIGKNTIIPFLLEKVKTYHPAPFVPGGGFWQYLQDSSDEYIYDAVKKGGEGCKTIDEVDIPKNIKIGIDAKKPDLLERRRDWKTATPEKTGLPTEIWRETITRLGRYFELRRKIVKGEITEINDLITYNLNIRRLVQDYLEQTTDKEFIRKFYKALISITILDPTCGSGAFLFAALNILEPLYEMCLQRMEEFYTENAKGNKDFEDRLQPLLSGEHPSRSYYIFKTIILNNLYGVDLMKEAVEIAKLRLFLKLVAEVDPSRRKKNFGLEPLPDIDFNIRSGNTLVGFATEGQLEEVVKNTDGDLIYEERVAELKSTCKSASASFSHFKKMQMTISSDSIVIRKAKHDYANAIAGLNEKLNRYLADTYGLGTQTQWKSKKEKEDAYNKWKNSHQPFHWFAEFYEIISKGGFDVVIGNPPYVEMSVKNVKYEVPSFKTRRANNLHAFCFERFNQLSEKKLSRNGIILPIGAFSTQNMKPLMNFIDDNYGTKWFSFYHFRPQPLFNGDKGANIATTILLTNIVGNNRYSTGVGKFNEDSRGYLFDDLSYIGDDTAFRKRYDYCFPKISSSIELSIFNKILTNNSLSELRSEIKTKQFICYRTAGGLYYKIILNFPFPYESTSNKTSYFYKDVDRNVITSFLNSSLQWLLCTVSFDTLNFKDYYIFSLPFSYNKLSSKNKNDLHALCDNLMNDYKKYAKHKHRGKTPCYEITASISKPIIDEIDKVLAKHYGFTEEELDFIINYDIKYRTGSETDFNEI
jgi:tRNA1(Val) A37 N6-methylase TrmN6